MTRREKRRYEVLGARGEGEVLCAKRVKGTCGVRISCFVPGFAKKPGTCPGSCRGEKTKRIPAGRNVSATAGFPRSWGFEPLGLEKVSRQIVNKMAGVLRFEIPHTRPDEQAEKQ